MDWLLLPRTSADLEWLDGNPYSLRSSAEDLRTLADDLDVAWTAAHELEQIKDGTSWYGEGFDAFRSTLDQNPKSSDITNAQTTLRSAADALDTLASRIGDCQSSVDWCRRRLDSLNVPAEGEIPEDLRPQVEAVWADYSQVREEYDGYLGDAAGTFDGLTGTTIYAEPPSGGLFGGIGDAFEGVADAFGGVIEQVVEYNVGILEGTWGLVQGAYAIVSMATLVYRPWEWDDAYATAVAMYDAFMADPQAFMTNMGKAVVNWDTFRESPSRWAGQLVPSVVLAVATGGAGTAATGLTRAGALASRSSRLSRGLDRAADAARNLDDSANVFTRMAASDNAAAMAATHALVTMSGLPGHLAASAWSSLTGGNRTPRPDPGPSPDRDPGADPASDPVNDPDPAADPASPDPAADPSPDPDPAADPADPASDPVNDPGPSPDPDPDPDPADPDPVNTTSSSDGGTTSPGDGTRTGAGDPSSTPDPAGSGDGGGPDVDVTDPDADGGAASDAGGAADTSAGDDASVQDPAGGSGEAGDGADDLVGPDADPAADPLGDATTAPGTGDTSSTTPSADTASTAHSSDTTTAPSDLTADGSTPTPGDDRAATPTVADDGIGDQHAGTVDDPEHVPLDPHDLRPFQPDASSLDGGDRYEPGRTGDDLRNTLPFDPDLRDRGDGLADDGRTPGADDPDELDDPELVAAGMVITPTVNPRATPGGAGPDGPFPPPPRPNPGDRPPGRPPGPRPGGPSRPPGGPRPPGPRREGPLDSTPSPKAPGAGGPDSAQLPVARQTPNSPDAADGSGDPADRADRGNAGHARGPERPGGAETPPSPGGGRSGGPGGPGGRGHGGPDRPRGPRDPGDPDGPDGSDRHEPTDPEDGEDHPDAGRAEPDAQTRRSPAGSAATDASDGLGSAAVGGRSGAVGGHRSGGDPKGSGNGARHDEAATDAYRPWDPDEDPWLGEVNPSGDMENCLDCTRAVEDRLSGRDPEATAAPGRPIRTAQDLADRYGGRFEDVGTVPHEARAEIVRRMLALGPGARGFVRCMRPNGFHHVFNVEHRRDEQGSYIRFIDGQGNCAGSFSAPDVRYNRFRFMHVPGTGHGPDGDGAGADGPSPDHGDGPDGLVGRRPGGRGAPDGSPNVGGRGRSGGPGGGATGRGRGRSGGPGGGATGRGRGGPGSPGGPGGPRDPRGPGGPHGSGGVHVPLGHRQVVLASADPDHGGGTSPANRAELEPAARTPDESGGPGGHDGTEDIDSSDARADRDRSYDRSEPADRPDDDASSDLNGQDDAGHARRRAGADGDAAPASPDGGARDGSGGPGGRGRGGSDDRRGPGDPDGPDGPDGPDDADDGSGGRDDDDADGAEHRPIDEEARRELLNTHHLVHMDADWVNAPDHRQVDRPYRLLNGPRFSPGRPPGSRPSVTRQDVEDWYRRLDARAEGASDDERRRIELEERYGLEGLNAEHRADLDHLPLENGAEVEQWLGTDAVPPNSPLARTDGWPGASQWRSWDPERYRRLADVDPHGRLSPRDRAFANARCLAGEMPDVYPNGARSFDDWLPRVNSIRMARAASSPGSQGRRAYRGCTPLEARALIHRRLDAADRGTMALVTCYRADGSCDVLNAINWGHGHVDFVRRDGSPGVFSGQGYTTFVYEELQRPPRPGGGDAPNRPDGPTGPDGGGSDGSTGGTSRRPGGRDGRGPDGSNGPDEAVDRHRSDDPDAGDGPDSPGDSRGSGEPDEPDGLDNSDRPDAPDVSDRGPDVGDDNDAWTDASRDPQRRYENWPDEILDEYHEYRVRHGAMLTANFGRDQDAYEQYVEDVASLFAEGGEFSRLWDTERGTFNETSWYFTPHSVRTSLITTLEYLRADRDTPGEGNRSAYRILYMNIRGQDQGLRGVTEHGTILIADNQTCAQTIETAVHEGFHAHQERVVRDCMSAHPQAETWRQNLRYTSPTYEDQYSVEDRVQPNEADARVFHEVFIPDLMRCIQRLNRRMGDDAG